MRAARGGLLAGAIVLVAALVGAIPAAAATTTAWASWQPLSGTGGAYTTTVQIAAQPAVTATMTSDSRAGQVGVISGATNWLSQGTPVGAKYGSSINQSYVNLRPKADNATSPSTTTYSFANPTPASGWTFVLGDIDADAVRIQAIGANGQALTAAQLGFRGGFNYCAPGVAGKPSCTGDATDVPTWDATTQTLTGNAAALDTSGAAAWFEPSVPITSLTFFFTRRSGFPVYQTWFASIARDITGVVTDNAEVPQPQPGATLTLTDANGKVVATTTSGADGSYSFPGVVATDGYAVRVTAPTDMIPVGEMSVPVNLTTADGVANFIVRDIVPVPVSGRVTDTEGNPIAGVLVTIGTQTTTTDAEGRYVIDDVPVGPQTATIITPDGYTIFSGPPPFTVPDDSEEEIPGIDFVLAEAPTLSGVVRAGGSGVAGITVTASGPGGVVLTTVTDEAGAYSFPRLDAGDYEITMTTPDGYASTGPTSQNETVAAADVENVDFELAKLGAFSGVVRTDDGAPVSGVRITLTTDEGTQTLTTDADGAYGLGKLPPGTYTLTITAPAGSTIVGPATLTVEVTSAGETFVDQDFTLAAIVVPPTDPPTDPEPPTTPPNNGGGTLPGTGLGQETFMWAGIGGAVLVLGAVLFVVSRRRSRRD
ncbi:MSCRAMM family protein [Microbacterium phyllosphaerae]|uniref:MSCRAMM family protein n=1 Tax=Microbacterium phyllosphaerae TaxID=124798 RepID=UPI0021690078|nr:carboxypeptidase-like regulatory domain-containing protein [Microbacterium phyllosphaerae]MCS3443079.1 LPXTG-motif cell wall-anchored protein [Microbacterium phyllosphaerae]